MIERMRLDSLRLFLILGLFLASSAGSAQAGPADPAAEGIRLLESGRFEEARSFFAASAAKNPRSATAAFYLGRAQFELKRYEAAAEALEKAVELAPDNSEYYGYLGRAYGLAAEDANPLRAPGLARKSRAAFEKAIAIKPDNLDARTDLAEYFMTAPSLLGGSVDAAKAQAEEIKKRDPARGHEVLIWIYLQGEEYDFAVPELQAAIRTSPSNPALRLQLGATYVKLQRYDPAFETGEEILKIDPGYAPALYLIGTAGALSGKHLDRAEECLQRYLGHRPTAEEPPLARAHLRLGQVYERKGNRALARQHYQQAVKLDPNLQEARDALKKTG